MIKGQIFVFLSLIFFCFGQHLAVISPQDFVQTFSNSRIKVISSPIGFKPKGGSLIGKIALAQPLSACTQIKQLQDYNENQDIFIMADDLGCLQSVKARNLAASGTYVGIIKRNINNTLHDKEVNTVHIPILQIQPNDFDRIVSYILKNPNVSINVIADFNLQQNRKKISMQLWMSPTQAKTYEYVMNFRNFISNQPQIIQFYPRFVLHSQTNRKQYIGCLSSGRFCPPELQFQGKPEGAEVVSEALRQIIIASKYTEDWLNYAYYYYFKCLKMDQPEKLWQQGVIQLCSENVMRSVGIDPQQIFKQYNKSFTGPRPIVDGNIYLEQQRQLYVSEKITKFPILLINGKQYDVENNFDQIKIRICNMINPNPTSQTQECQLLTNPSYGLSTSEIFIGAAIFLAILVAIMFACKQFIYRKMKQQMRGEVDKTLSQYYRYMETFEQADPSVVGKVPLVQPKIETNQIGSVELDTYKTNK